MQHPLAILGMHRSGTSAVTRIVNFLGVYLGEEEDLLEPAPDNPSGFWERRDVLDLHERLLCHLGTSWAAQRRLPLGWHRHPSVTPFREELVALVRDRFPSDRPWAWKDPRASILLPIWRDALADSGTDAFCILVVRHPREVAGSLMRRDGIEAGQAVGTWLHYNLAMLWNTRGMRRAVISWERLIRDWPRQIGRCSEQLGIVWPEASRQAEERVNVFLDPSLVHTGDDSGKVEGTAAYPAAVELHDRIDAARADPEALSSPAWLNRLETLFFDLPLVIPTTGPAGSWRALETDERLGWALSRRRELEARVRQLESSVLEARERLAASELEAVDARGRLEDLETALRDRELEAAALRSARHELAAELERVTAQLESTLEWAESLEANLAAANCRLLRVEQTLLQVTDSRSWRLTAPLRALLAALRRPLIARPDARDAD